MKLFGIDFPATFSSKHPIRVAIADLNGNNEVIIRRIDSLHSNKEFEDFLAQAGPWFAGINIPFGLPWSFWNEISEVEDWRGRIQALVQSNPAYLQQKVQAHLSQENNLNVFQRLSEEIAGFEPSSEEKILQSIASMVQAMPFMLNANLSLIPVCMTDSPKQVIETCPSLLAEEVFGLLDDSKDLSKNNINLESFFSKGGLREILESIFEYKISFDDLAINDMRTLFNEGSMDCLFSLLQSCWAAKYGKPSFGITGLNHPVAKIEGRFAIPKFLARPKEMINYLQDHDNYLLDQIKRLSEIGQSLSGQLKLPALLETIVKEARSLTRADGGTLYILEDDVLEFKIVQNESLSLNMGCSQDDDPLPFKPVKMRERNVSAYVALQGTTVKIDDVYHAKGFDFSGPKEFDTDFDYKTQSMLVVPMRDYDGSVIGVLQLLNSKNAKTHAVESFSQHDQGLVESLASQAAIAISNSYLVADLQKVNCDLVYTRDKALDASRAKSNFLANMSHELRTPMNAVIGYSEMLIEDAVDQGLDEFESDLQKINTAGKHLLNLINQVLDLSKVESGKMEIYLEKFKVSVLVQEVITTIQPLAAKENNQLTIACHEELGTIKADITKVRQILFNLLSNACKFTKNGKIILDIEQFDKNNVPWIRYRVIDTGIGISPYEIRKLFSDFSQVDPSTTRKFGGTGLGLAISRRFSRMMGGDVAVISQPDFGSTFTLELPMEVKPVEHPRRRFSDIT